MNLPLPRACADHSISSWLNFFAGSGQGEGAYFEFFTVSLVPGGDKKLALGVFFWYFFPAFKHSFEEPEREEL
jgi:hypothetical protein